MNVVVEILWDRWPMGVLVIACFFVIGYWYKYNTDMIKQHREDRKERQKKDDERLRMYQESNSMAVSAIHWLEKTMAEMHILIQTKLQ